MGFSQADEDRFERYIQDRNWRQRLDHKVERNVFQGFPWYDGLTPTDFEPLVTRYKLRVQQIGRGGVEGAWHYFQTQFVDEFQSESLIVREAERLAKTKLYGQRNNGKRLQAIATTEPAIRLPLRLQSADLSLVIPNHLKVLYDSRG